MHYLETVARLFFKVFSLCGVFQNAQIINTRSSSLRGVNHIWATVAKNVFAQKLNMTGQFEI